MSEMFGGDGPGSGEDETVAGPAHGQAPVAALQAERRRRQAAERERDALLARLDGQAEDADEADTERTEDEFDPETIDAGDLDALDGAWVAEDLAELNEQLNASEAVARSQFGDEAVDAAEIWAEEAMARDPALAAEVLTHGDPYAFALGLAMAARAPVDRRPPPRSLISAPSAGGPAHVPSGPGLAYDALFAPRG